jgi:hypothetical protein
MNKADIKRAALHFPVGVFAAWLATVAWVLCLVFGAGFLTYEVIEDWRSRDKGYKDVFGFLIGLGVGAVALYFINGRIPLP